MTPKSQLTGQPTDISNLCEFRWYEWVQFRYDDNQFPEPSDVKLCEEFDVAIEKRHGTLISSPPDKPTAKVEPAYQDAEGLMVPGMHSADDIPDYDQYVIVDALFPHD